MPGVTGTPREIYDCERVRAYLDSYLQGQVPPPEARAMRLHIHACPDCHARVVARDPVQIFAPLADEERGEEFWIGFWPAVRADIRALETESRAWRVRLLRPVLAAGAAAAILLVAALAVLRPWRESSPAPAGPGAQAVQVVAEGWQEVLPDSQQEVGITVPAVMEVRSPSAKVLSMKVYGGDRGVSELVLIVDEEIQL